MDKYFFFETVGFSMRPFLKGGERLIIKKDIFEELSVGDIILYRTNNQTVCHRVVKRSIKDKEIIFFVRGDNSTALPEIITKDVFIGKMIGVIYNNRIIIIESKMWRIVNRGIVIIAPLLSCIIKKIKPYYKKINV